MKLCIVTEYFYPDNTGGTGTVLSKLGRRLKDRHPELELHVVTGRRLYRGEQLLGRFEDWEGIKIHRLSAPRSNRPSTFWRLVSGLTFTALVTARLARLPRFDVCLVVTNPPMVPMALQILKKLKGTPYVYLIHDLYPDVAVALKVLPADGLAARVFRNRQRGWLHGAYCTVVLGRCMGKYLTRHYALEAARISVITNWADPDQIPVLDKNTRFRAKNGLEGKIALYAGNLGRYQDFDNLLSAASLLAKRKSGITLVMVGDGARREEIARRISAEKLANVRLLPFVSEEEFPDMLATADVSVVTLEPSAEGLGVPSKFYSFLASGRPTVAIVGSESEVARVIAEADCGVRVDQGNPGALAAALEGLVSDPARLERLGQNARRVLLERFTLEHASERFYEVLQRAGMEAQGGNAR